MGITLMLFIVGSVMYSMRVAPLSAPDAPEPSPLEATAPSLAPLAAEVGCTPLHPSSARATSIAKTLLLVAIFSVSPLSAPWRFVDDGSNLNCTFVPIPQNRRIYHGDPSPCALIRVPFVVN
jgi:hypothetical protein